MPQRLFRNIHRWLPRALSVFAGATDGPRQLRQLRKDSYTPPPLFMVEGGRTADHGARLDIAMGAALRRNNHAVPDLAVTGHAHLAGQDHVAANLRGTGQTHLS